MNPVEISADEFRRLAEHVTKLAADYLENIDSHVISPTTDGAETVRLFRSAMPERGLGASSLDTLPDVIRLSRIQNGRFFGYVLGSGEPVGAVADLLASVINQNVTAWRSGPAAVMIEQTVVDWLSQAIGCTGFQGHLTGGGSSANLMGLTMAREIKAAANEKGVTPGGVVYASDEAHMSIAKSVALLGIGRENLRLIGTDASFRMIPEELEASIVKDKSAGKTPLAIVASAGTVNTGSVDPLRKIAEVAQRHGAWFHIDGAYGALAAMADRTLFDGLELADSISLDPHKWLYQPLDCGCLLYRSSEAARATFAHSGEYARTLNADPVEGFAFFEESLELSRRFRALKLWLSLRYHGFAAFRQSIAKDMAQARRLADAIQREPVLELLAPVELSAVCFRYRGTGTENDLDRFNLALLKSIVSRGRIYLSNASLRGTFCLRACVVNHRTKNSDIDSVIPEVLAAAREIG
jgi:aromatic-L-amino-acid decarboxylase